MLLEGDDIRQNSAVNHEHYVLGGVAGGVVLPDGGEEEWIAQREKTLCLDGARSKHSDSEEVLSLEDCHQKTNKRLSIFPIIYHVNCLLFSYFC